MNDPLPSVLCVLLPPSVCFSMLGWCACTEGLVRHVFYFLFFTHRNRPLFNTRQRADLARFSSEQERG
jgi:hypothetical protein